MVRCYTAPTGEQTIAASSELHLQTALQVLNTTVQPCFFPNACECVHESCCVICGWAGAAGRVSARHRLQHRARDRGAARDDPVPELRASTGQVAQQALPYLH